MLKNNIAIMLFLIIIIIVFGLSVRMQFKSLKQKIHIVSCAAVKETVEKALADFRLKHPDKKPYPGEIVDIPMLFKEGFLKEYHLCPAGGAYKINRYGEIICTFHDKDE